MSNFIDYSQLLYLYFHAFFLKYYLFLPQVFLDKNSFVNEFCIRFVKSILTIFFNVKLATYDLKARSNLPGRILIAAT